MRVLNLGVLVCVGGILAALPFRHSKQQQQALEHPALATGPTLAEPNSIDPGKRYSSDLTLHRSSEADAKSLERLVKYQPPSTPVERRPLRPQMSLPLTYEDLAVPVEPSPTMRERFNATVNTTQTRRDLRGGSSGTHQTNHIPPSFAAQSPPFHSNQSSMMTKPATSVPVSRERPMRSMTASGDRPMGSQTRQVDSAHADKPTGVSRSFHSIGGPQPKQSKFTSGEIPWPTFTGEGPTQESREDNLVSAPLPPPSMKPAPTAPRQKRWIRQP